MLFRSRFKSPNILKNEKHPSDDECFSFLVAEVGLEPHDLRVMSSKIGVFYGFVKFCKVAIYKGFAVLSFCNIQLNNSTFCIEVELLLNLRKRQKRRLPYYWYTKIKSVRKCEQKRAVYILQNLTKPYIFDIYNNYRAGNPALSLYISFNARKTL